jgi:chromosome partitioning protein
MKGHSLSSGETDQQKALPEDVVLSEEALPEEVETRTEVAPQAAPTPVAEPGGVPAGPSGEGESEPEPAAEADPDPATEKQPEPVPAVEIAPPATEQLAAKAEPALVEASQTVGSEQNADAVPVEVANGRMVQAASGNPLPRILAIANQKGGVGKTTTSVNLGAALAELGFRILVIDLDPQGNATTGLGIDARNFERSMYDVLMRDTSLEDCIEPTSTKNLFVAPSTIDLAGAEIELVPAFSRETKLKRAIETVIDDFDFILIDCPPSLGLITVNGLAAADEVLVPVQCEYYALEGLTQLMRNVHLVASNLNAGLDVSTVVLTMYDARTKLSDQVAQEVRQHFGNKVCRSVIPRTVRLSEAPSFGQPITAFDPTSRGAIAYRELAKEVSGGAS